MPISFNTAISRSLAWVRVNTMKPIMVVVTTVRITKKRPIWRAEASINLPTIAAFICARV